MAQEFTYDFDQWNEVIDHIRDACEEMASKAAEDMADTPRGAERLYLEKLCNAYQAAADALNDFDNSGIDGFIEPPSL